jgi:transaldolase
MKPTQLLNELGQRIWLDNITRDLITSGTLRRYIHDFSVTGLTSNPTIFDHAIGETNAYDAAIQLNARRRVLGEALFLELAFEDLRNAADLFQPTFEASAGEDGWVSMEVSPLLARDTKKTVERVAFSTIMPTGPTSSSRSPEHRKGFLRSRSPSSPEFRSTSRCSFPGSSISPRRRPTSGVSSGGSRRV